MSEPNPSQTKRHLLTVMLEDYFHVSAFNQLILREQWYRFETRFERNTLKALDMLDRFNIKATFYVLGWVAEKQPELIREVARRGHELASRGLYYRSTREMLPDEFRDDIKRAREALELASGQRVLGYRASRRWSSPSDLWALDILAEEGFAHDSSIVPLSRAFSHEPWRRFAHKHRVGDKEIWEFPTSTMSVLGWMLPIAGGNYFRQLPHTLLKHAVEHWHQTYDAPFVMYTHVWELDPEQPRLSGISPLTRFRHYRNLDKMAWVLEDYFKKYSFMGIADYLGLNTTVAESPEFTEASEPIEISSIVERRQPVSTVEAMPVEATPTNAPAPVERVPVTIVVPCFNEEATLPYLANTLRSVQADMENHFDLRFIFIDDSSRDGTFEALRLLFGSWHNCTFARHTRNLGVAASILHGVRLAKTEIVCSIDCDCTYDPHDLRNMVPLLTENIDLVTASPYHPQGEVRNVPGWRLGLSRVASFLYRQVLRQKLFTYTSCFRVYRRSAVVDLRLRETGFLGVAETVGRLDLRGAKIIEHPATLEVRLFGQSKMKVLRTIRGHLKLLARLSAMRLRNKIDIVGAPLPVSIEPQQPVEISQKSSSTSPMES